MRVNFKLEGLKECEEALAELPKATTRNVLLRVLKAAGVFIRDAGEQLAPRLKGGLKAGYTVSTKLSRTQKKKNKKESNVEVYVGPSPHAKSVQTEFGNAHQAAEPHLRPAFDGESDRSLKFIVEQLADEIERARKRLARKAERLAAKIAAGK